MDDPTTMLYAEARRRADATLELLGPHCSRISEAGGVRRHKATCHDIEICCIPSAIEQPVLFGPAPIIRSPAFSAAVRSLGTVVKGRPDDGKFFQVRTPDNIQIDIFTAEPANWGLILAIRTGSADYSHHVLANRWVAMGFHSFEGYLYRDGAKVEVPTEQELYRLCDLRFVQPTERNL